MEVKYLSANWICLNQNLNESTIKLKTTHISAQQLIFVNSLVLR